MKTFLHWSRKLRVNWVKVVLITFLLATYSILTTNLGRDALFDWDEGIYAQLGSEIIESGNWLTNTWNYSTWFEKPPGVSWLSAIGQMIAGHTPYGARLLMPVVATLTLYMVYLLGKKLKNKHVGLMATGFLLGFNLFLGRTRAVNTDMPLLLGIITTLYFILTNQSVWKVALVVAFSVWFKGLAGLLPLIIAFPLFIAKGKKYISSFIIHCSLFIIPWHLYSFINYGKEFLNPYFLEQVMTRITSPIEFHLESRWFYFQYLYENLGLGMIIVLVLALLSLVYNFYLKRKWQDSYILVWWLIIPIVIFTLAKTRLFWYILPVYPAVALILAYYLDSFTTNKSARRVFSILAVGVMIQGLYSAYLSVEPDKVVAATPDRLIVADTLSRAHSTPLAVLVPPSERMAEAILPSTQRISSSFRYGGMPSVVYYYQSPVIFFYNVDEFIEYLGEGENVIAMISVDDQELVNPFNTLVTTDEYLGITRGGL